MPEIATFDRLVKELEILEQEVADVGQVLEDLRRHRSEFDALQSEWTSIRQKAESLFRKTLQESDARRDDWSRLLERAEGDLADMGDRWREHEEHLRGQLTRMEDSRNQIASQVEQHRLAVDRLLSDQEKRLGRRLEEIARNQTQRIASFETAQRNATQEQSARLADLTERLLNVQTGLNGLRDSIGPVREEVGALGTSFDARLQGLRADLDRQLADLSWHGQTRFDELGQRLVRADKQTRRLQEWVTILAIALVGAVVLAPFLLR